MLGKTHTVNSLAFAHMGLVGYTAYVGGFRLFGEKKASAEPLSVFGFELGEPFALTSYALIVTTVALFVLWILRIGNAKLRLGYFGGILLGLFALWVIFDTLFPLMTAGVILAFALGSMLPDIDSENSTIGRYVKPISRAIPHRTITHTVWAVALLAGLSWYFGSVYLWALTAGYTVHIVQDSFSRQGIAWFYPIIGGYDSYGESAVKRGRKTALSYRVGGTGETFVFYGSVLTHLICVGVVTYWLLGS